LDFYSRQVEARRQTRWLVLGFILALAAVVFALDTVLFALFASAKANEPVIAPFEYAARNPGAALFCTLIVLGAVGLASMFKSLQLRSGGGGTVARSLGGVRVESDTADLKRKRLRNIVEEMAIAANVPVPEIYVLEHETAINAFAAGHTPANAAVTVTQGALDRLNREQLQGVIGHEFSHVVNGDMRLNIQLMGWLFGLLVVAVIGRTILRIAPRGGRKGGGAILLAAFAMMALGYIGLLAGRILQAAVSRQRERLADASAVQFTRNPGGLKEALLKIAGLSEGSRLTNADAEQVAHMLFAPGLKRLFATHPPIGERIRELDPSFNIKTLPRLAEQALGEGIGLDESVHMSLAPPVLSQPDSHTPSPDSSSISPRVWVLAMVLSHDETVRNRQLILLANALDPADLAAIRQCAPLCQQLDPLLRLPSLLKVFPALRRLSPQDRQSLRGLVDDLIMADAKIDVFEFCLAQLLETLLQDELEARTPHGGLSAEDAASELQILFATLAQAGATDERSARMAYESGMQMALPARQSSYVVLNDWPAQLGAALPRLEKLHPLAKKAMIEGLVETVAHDDVLNASEAELLRTVCAILHCPPPRLLPALA